MKSTNITVNLWFVENFYEVNEHIHRVLSQINDLEKLK